MFSELFETIKVAFGIMIAFVIIMIIVGIIKGKSALEEQTEREQREEEKKRKIINTVISEARQFPTDVVISQRDEVGRVCIVLRECKRTGDCKIREFAWIRVGDKFGVSLDLDTACTILQYLNAEIERRGG